METNTNIKAGCTEGAIGARHPSARRGAVIVGVLLAIVCRALGGVWAEELRNPARFIRDLQDHLLEQAYRTSYAAGDFNGDGFGDLAIGIPYATVAGKRAAGKVIVINGDHHGLTEIKTVYYQGGKGRYGMPHANEAGDLVGFSLAAGDFNGDGIADLAVGAPGQDLTRDDGVTYVDAGAIFVAHGEAGVGLNFMVPGGIYAQDAGPRPPQFDLAGDMSPGSLLGFSL